MQIKNSPCFDALGVSSGFNISVRAWIAPENTAAAALNKNPPTIRCLLSNVGRHLERTLETVYGTTTDVSQHTIIFYMHSMCQDGLQEAAESIVGALVTAQRRNTFSPFAVVQIRMCDGKCIAEHAQWLPGLLRAAARFSRASLVYHFVPFPHLREFLCAARSTGPVPMRIAAYLTFETDCVPIEFANQFNAGVIDVLMVPSQQNRAAFARGAEHVPIAHVVPHVFSAFARLGVHQLRAKWHGVMDTRPLVLYVINNSNDARKNFYFTIRYALEWMQQRMPRDWSNVKKHTRTPPPPPRVFLIAKGHAGATMDALAHFVHVSKLKDSVRLIARTLSPHEIMQLHCASHVWISLSHGEGVGMGTVEAARQGSLVVVPRDGGGFCEYIGHEARTAHWVRSQTVPVGEEQDRTEKEIVRAHNLPTCSPIFLSACCTGQRQHWIKTHRADFFAALDRAAEYVQSSSADDISADALHVAARIDSFGSEDAVRSAMLHHLR